MDASKKTLGKGISNFFGALKGAGRKVETDVSELAKTDVPRKFVKDVKKTAKKIFGKEAIKARREKPSFREKQRAKELEKKEQTTRNPMLKGFYARLREKRNKFRKTINY